ncbi:hypothetical protein GOP47_0028765 [Adiantum capillus-veneris]|nr:hypothetical protein GOP47_0028765 [Adiantum capillus-veneris]
MFGVESRLVPCCPPLSLQRAADEVQFRREDIAVLLRSRPSFLGKGKSIHASIVRSGLLHDPYIGNLLIGMYRDCGALDDARIVFHLMHDPSIVSWTVMMAALCDHGLCHEAIYMFHDMQQRGSEPNYVTFITILNACTCEQTLVDGYTIHTSIVGHGLQCDILVATSLISMYGRCGDIHTARVIFDSVEPRDLFLWNSMIAGYSQCGLRKQAFTLLKEMQQQGITPNQVTYIHVLAACSSPEDLEDGKYAHSGLLETGLDCDFTVGTALINMYGKCGAPHLARAAFNNITQHDVISWTTMIAAHSSHGQGNEAFELFESFYHIFQPTQVTIVSVLSACADIKHGCTVHMCAVQYGYDTNVIAGTALLNMYGRCGSLEDAWLVFSKVQPSCDLVCWNSMIALCGNHGNINLALILFEKMQQGGVEPDSLTFNGLLCACASPAALLNGKRIHECIKQKGLELDIIVANALVNMYSKCGAWDEASAMFAKIDKHNLSSWNSIIAGCCKHGHANDALQMFEAMQREGVEPNDITYLCLLNACSHAGLVDKCYELFLLILGNCQVKPRLDHLTCVVGLLGRSGRLEDAENLVLKTALQHDSAIWLTLLGACSTHGDVSRSERIADIIFELDPNHETAYIVLANLYVATGRLNDWMKLEEVMLARGLDVGRE